MAKHAIRTSSGPISNSLSLFERKKSTGHPIEAEALHLMGLIKHKLSSRAEAIDYLQRALSMRESLLADDHPFVARTCYELGVLHSEQDDESAQHFYMPNVRWLFVKLN